MSEYLPRKVADDIKRELAGIAAISIPPPDRETRDALADGEVLSAKRDNLGASDQVFVAVELPNGRKLALWVWYAEGKARLSSVSHHNAYHAKYPASVLPHLRRFRIDASIQGKGEGQL